MSTLPFAFIQNFGGPEILIILLVLVLLFGPKKLPELSRAIGKSIGEFKKGRQELDKELQEADEKGKEERPDVSEPKS